ncbi:glycoprotein H [Ateline gammaherpesvirus 3]|uniref:Glycoprotein H n=1 Tax=Ateline herpesvirus 3 TaxID=85618 RepID=Q9YTP4_ATHV3|nr:glycoprotein H [Ateline gammaherpesvirus 3]AAC95546.1 glycoprotein H [Ateline gammaherpesvirus 3]
MMIFSLFLVFLHILEAIDSYQLPRPRLNEPPADQRLQMRNGYNTTLIEFDYDFQSFHLNWTKIIEHIPHDELVELWHEANVTEPLVYTLLKRSATYRPETNVHIPGHGNSYACTLPYWSYTIDRWDDNKTNGYLGNFGIPSKIVLNELFYDFRYVFTNMQFYTEATYVLHCLIGANSPAYPTISCHITPNYLFISVEFNKFDSLTLLFGYSHRLPPLKGHVVYKDIEGASNDVFSLVIFSTYELFGQHIESFKFDMAKVFREIIETPPLDFIKKLQDEMFTIEIRDGCNVNNIVNPRTFLFVFKAVVAHFLVIDSLKTQQHVLLNCFAHYMSELEFLRKLMESCFEFFEFNFPYTVIETLAASQAQNVPRHVITTLSHQDKINILSLFRLSRHSKSVSNIATAEIIDLISFIYTSYSYKYMLTSSDRKMLLDAYIVLNDIIYKNKTKKQDLLPYVLSSSMCTSLEIGNLLLYFGQKDVLDVYETFSPCYLSLRFDFTKEKLLTEFPQSSLIQQKEINLGTNGFFQTLHRRHHTSLEILPIIKCIKSLSTDIILSIPLTHITYIISTKPVPNSKIYDVSEVFLKTSMTISAVNNDCKPYRGGPSAHQIPVIYNVTVPRRGCPYCNSVVLSYDESQGFQSMMYITDTYVQENLFTEHSPFFGDENLHIHYLILMNNGSVIEVRGAYRARLLNFILVIMVFIAFLVALYLLYKLFVYLR